MTKTYIAATLASLFATSALAVPPTTSAYSTDPQSSYVYDATSEGVNQVSMIMCVMTNMAPATQVNQGPYVAMIDQKKCDQGSRSSTSGAGATSDGANASAYDMRAVVDSTRTDNNSPMIGKIWIDMEEEENRSNIWVRLRADQSPSTGNPYGVFRLDYCGRRTDAAPGSQCRFNGYIDAKSNEILYYDNSNEGEWGTQTRAMSLTAGSTTSGAGSLYMLRTPLVGSPEETTFQFAFNSTHFRRSDGAADKCFDRRLAQAKSSVWRYGTYDATTGDRFDSTNPGFPVRVSDGTNSYYGYASYWGLYVNGLNLNSLADASSVPNITIVRQSRGSNATTTEYGLQKLSGKLTKFTRQNADLASIDKIPLNAWGPFYEMTGNNPDLLDVWQVELHWDNTAGQFVITGKQVCVQDGGCTVTPIGPVAIPNTDANAQRGIHGWSQALGGEVNIPGKATAYASGDWVRYFIQSKVVPGGAGAPAALYCLNNCMTSAALSSFVAGGSPYDPTTQMQWGSGTTTVAYTFDASGLKQAGAAMTMTDPAKATGQFQWGVRTGKLFDAALPACAFDNARSCEPDADYYVWETGPKEWNQYIALTSGGTPVPFDPPKMVAFQPDATNSTLTNGDDLLGKTLQLQFQGFGDLHGIPGKCVSEINNQEVPCGNGTRYVPSFVINDGATLNIDGTNVLIKYLDRELRLAEVALSECTNGGLTLTGSGTLPTGGLVDPSNSSDTANYIGTKPTPASEVPKVLHGVVQ